MSFAASFSLIVLFQALLFLFKLCQTFFFIFSFFKKCPAKRMFIDFCRDNEMRKLRKDSLKKFYRLGLGSKLCLWARASPSQKIVQHLMNQQRLFNNKASRKREKYFIVGWKRTTNLLNISTKFMLSTR